MGSERASPDFGHVDLQECDVASQYTVKPQGLHTKFQPQRAGDRISYSGSRKPLKRRAQRHNGRKLVQRSGSTTR